MSSISITRPHSLGLDAARSAVEQVGQDLAAEYGISHAWRGNTLDVKRSGMEGQLRVSDTDVRIELKLGFLLSALKGSIEKAVHTELDKRLA